MPMRLSKIMLVNFLIALLLSISIVDSIWIPSSPKVASAMPENQVAANDQGKGITINLEGTSRSSDISLPIGYNPISYSSDQIQIKKSINPSNNDYYLLNKVYAVNVDLKGIGRDVDDIVIEEKVDPNLQMINFSELYPLKYDPFYKNEINIINRENYTYDGNKNIIYIKINRLESKHHINYTYKIKTPNKPGVFDLITSARIAGNASFINDLDFSKEMIVKPPEFDVNLDIQKQSADTNDPINVTYYIRCKSPCSQESYPCNLSFENSDQYHIYLNKTNYRSNIPYHGELIQEQLGVLNYTNESIILVYDKSGMHRLPSILVEGYHYPFDTEISVSNPIIKFIEDWGPAISILGLFLSWIIAGYELSLYRRTIPERKKVKLNAKDKSVPIIALILASSVCVFGVFYYPTIGISVPPIILALILILIVFPLVILINHFESEEEI